MIKSIGRILGKFGDITLKIFIILGDTNSNANYKPKPSFKKWIAYGQIESITYDFTTFLQLDYNKDYKSYDKTKRFNFHISQVWKLNKFFSNTISVIRDYGNEIYYLDKDNGNRLSMFRLDNDQIQKFTITSFGYMSNHCIRSIPAIISDYQDNQYEGYRLFFDNSDKFIDLSYDELCSLSYILKKTDFINLSQAIVNSTILWYSQNARNDLRMTIDTAADAYSKQATAINTYNENIIDKQLPYSRPANVFKGLVGKEDNK